MRRERKGKSEERKGEAKRKGKGGKGKGKRERRGGERREKGRKGGMRRSEKEERKGGAKRRSAVVIARATWNGVIGEGTAGRGREAVEKPWLKGFGRGSKEGRAFSMEMLFFFQA